MIEVTLYGDTLASFKISPAALVQTAFQIPRS